MRMLSLLVLAYLVTPLPAADGMAGMGSYLQGQDPCTVTVTLEAVLGNIEDPVSLESAMEVYVAEVPWGGWLVTERGKEVIEYGADGVFFGTFGHRGEGPGELKDPNAVVVDRTDSTWISDDRGRAVIFGPDRLPARTLISPGLFQIEGFSEAGNPFAILTRYLETPGGVKSWRYTQVWNREGQPLSALGPGHFESGGRGVTVNELVPAQGVIVGDSLGIVPTGWEAWLTFWSESREWFSTPADSVWRTFGFPSGRPGSWSDGRALAVSSSDNGGFWILGVIRRLPKSQEDALIQRNEGKKSAVERGESPKVSNAVYDGVILHSNSDGTVTCGALVEDYPRGFAGPDQFYTFKETEVGLIQIQVWRFGRG